MKFAPGSLTRASGSGSWAEVQCNMDKNICAELMAVTVFDYCQKWNPIPNRYLNFGLLAFLTNPLSENTLWVRHCSLAPWASQRMNTCKHTRFAEMEAILQKWHFHSHRYFISIPKFMYVRIYGERERERVSHTMSIWSTPQLSEWCQGGHQGKAETLGHSSLSIYFI